MGLYFLVDGGVVGRGGGVVGWVVYGCEVIGGFGYLFGVVCLVVIFVLLGSLLVLLLVSKFL